MSTTVSRGIESVALAPPPMRMSRIESERDGCPIVCAPASGTALVREVSLSVARRPDTRLGRALEAGRELTGPMITELANEGDPVACAAMEVIGRALGVGLANLVNIFNPQVVVIGGGG